MPAFVRYWSNSGDCAVSVRSMLLGGAESGLFVFDVLRLKSLGLPGLAVIVSGDLEHPGAGLRIAK